jgi:hypothetical protein
VPLGEEIRIGGLSRCCKKAIQEREKAGFEGEIIVCPNAKCNTQAIYKRCWNEERTEEILAWHWQPH